MADTPESRLLDPKTLCSIGLRAQLMTGFFREWLTRHFSDEMTIEAPSLRSMLWKQIDSSKLVIESATRWHPRKTEGRPAILIHRNDLNPAQKLSIANKLHGNIDLTGAEHYAILEAGSHTLFCISPLGEEAEIIGGEVTRDLRQFSDKIREAMNLHRFEWAGTGSPKVLEEAKQNFVVPVTFAYVNEEHWSLIPHAPYLKRIVFNIDMFMP